MIAPIYNYSAVCVGSVDLGLKLGSFLLDQFISMEKPRMAFRYKKSFLMSEVGVNLKDGLCTQKSDGASSFIPGNVS